MLHQQKPPRSVLEISQDFFSDLGLELPTEFHENVAEQLYPKFIASLTDTEQKPLWSPVNAMQRKALTSPAFEIYCGGRAGTGKTDLMLGAAILNHQRSIIFRTEFSQLEAIEERTREILRNTGAEFNGQSKRWRDLPSGGTLRFGALKFDKDTDKYYGRAYDYIAFDEIPKFKEKHYLTVWGWARSAVAGQRVRIICTGNPPSYPEEMWVKRRWGAWVDIRHPNPAKPGELRWYVNLNGKDTEVDGPDAEVMDENGVLLKPLSRTFIPGELLDFYKGTSYEATLDALPPVLRAQLRDGDFTATEDDAAGQLIPTSWVQAAIERWETQPQPEGVPLSAIGVDVARGGGDKTVITKRYGHWFGMPLKYEGRLTQDASSVVQKILENVTEKERNVPILIDLAGVGASPYDLLQEHGFKVDGFNSASRSTFRDISGRLTFVNRRAEAWWKFREALDPSSDENIAVPPDPELIADLTAPTWKLTAQGIKIEEKDAIIKRLGRSPDAGDAVVMNYNAVIRGNLIYF